MDMKRTSPLGFSLLELLVALAFLMLLVGISAPSIASLRGKSKLQREAERLRGILTSLSLRAVQQEDDATLLVTKENYTARFSKTPKRRALYREINPPVKLLTSSREVITFYRSGVTTPTTFELGDGASRCTVRLSLRGRVTSTC